MNWGKFFGSVLYEKLKMFCDERNISISSVIRAAVAQYVGK